MGLFDFIANYIPDSIRYESFLGYALGIDDPIPESDRAIPPEIAINRVIDSYDRSYCGLSKNINLAGSDKFKGNQRAMDCVKLLCGVVQGRASENKEVRSCFRYVFSDAIDAEETRIINHNNSSRIFHPYIPSRKE